MDFGRRQKLVAAVLFIPLAVLFAGTIGVNLYVDWVSPPLNEAEYPEEAFEGLHDRLLEEDRFEKKPRKHIGPEALGNGFESRAQVSKYALLTDVVSTFGVFYDPTLSTEPSYPIGFWSSGCRGKKSFSDIIGCQEEVHSYGHIAAGDIRLATVAGDLSSHYKNSTITKTTENLWKRGDYYGETLETGDMPTLLAYQEGRGLYIITEKVEGLKIDGERVETSERGVWHHADVDLETGYHQVMLNGKNITFNVYYPVRHAKTRDGRLKVADLENAYSSLKIETSKGTKTVQLESNLTSTRLEQDNANLTFIGENFKHREARSRAEDINAAEEMGISSEKAGKIKAALRFQGFLARTVPGLERPEAVRAAYSSWRS